MQEIWDSKDRRWSGEWIRDRWKGGGPELVNNSLIRHKSHLPFVLWCNRVINSRFMQFPRIKNKWKRAPELLSFPILPGVDLDFDGRRWQSWVLKVVGAKLSFRCLRDQSQMHWSNSWVYIFVAQYLPEATHRQHVFFYCCSKKMSTVVGRLRSWWIHKAAAAETGIPSTKLFANRN